MLVAITSQSVDPFQVTLIFIDITEKRRAERDRGELLAELRDERALLEAVIDQMPAVVLISSRADGAVRGNRQAVRYFGEFPKAGIAPASYNKNMLHRPDGSPYSIGERPLFRASVNGEVVENEEAWIVGPGGTKEHFSISASPVLGADGKVIAGVSVGHDITQKRREQRYESLLSASGRVFAVSLDTQTVFQQLADLVVPEFADWCHFAFLNPDGTFRNIAVDHPDPRMQELNRRSRIADNVPVPNDPRSTVVARRSSMLIPRVSQEMRQETALTPDHEALHRDLAIHSAMIAPLICRGEAVGVLAFYSSQPGRCYDDRDLQLLDELARRLSLSIDNAQLYSQAQEAIRVRDEFLSIASHELKTPLTSLKLQLILARKTASQVGDTQQARRALEEKLDVLERQSDRLWTLVEDLLDMSRIRSGKFKMDLEKICLAELLREVVQRQASLCEEAHCPLEISLDESVVGEWDRSRLDQVMVNLISNALKYGAGKPIRVSLERRGAFARVHVRDHGIGIRSDDLERIFHRFERAVPGENYGGLGLGLYIARQIVEAHGGMLRVESEAGKGADFIMDLPLDPV